MINYYYDLYLHIMEKYFYKSVDKYEKKVYNPFIVIK